jgi:hypothetical protein
MGVTQATLGSGSARHLDPVVSTFGGGGQSMGASEGAFHHQHATRDAMETYFECITTCSLEDGECVTRCVEELRENG